MCVSEIAYIAMSMMRLRISAIFLTSTSLSTTTSCAFVHTTSFSSRQIQNIKCSTSLYQNRSSTSSSDRLTLDSIVQSLKEGKYKKILVVSGAGVSVSAGIPDVSS